MPPPSLIATSEAIVTASNRNIFGSGGLGFPLLFGEPCGFELFVPALLGPPLGDVESVRLLDNKSIGNL
jgi:hypothetical protein